MTSSQMTMGLSQSKHEALVRMVITKMLNVKESGHCARQASSATVVPKTCLFEFDHVVAFFASISSVVLQPFRPLSANCQASPCSLVVPHGIHIDSKVDMLVGMYQINYDSVKALVYYFHTWFSDILVRYANFVQ